MKRLRITVEGKSYDVAVEFLDEPDAAAAATSRPSAPTPSARVAAPVAVPAAPAPAAPVAAGAGSVVAPLSAVVISIDVTVGATVAAGDKLITLEAMKMNTLVTAPQAGTVQAIHVKPGDGVEEGQAMVTLG